MLDDLVCASERRMYQVDASLKRDFNEEKVELAKERATELVNELPYSKKAIAVYFRRVFGYVVKDGFSVGLGVHGRRREISLIITFNDNVPSYRLSSVINPDFVSGKVE